MRNIKAASCAVLAALVGALCIASEARASTGAGAEPLSFLSLDAGARPAALGGAYTALADDSNALLYNPGALGFVKTSEATFMYNQYFQDVKHEYVGLALSNGIGLNLNYLDFGSVPRTTIANPGGTGDGTGLTDLALSAGYGYKVLDSLSLGAAGKIIRENIDGTIAQTFALDAGVLYEAPFAKGLALGAAVQNLGNTIKYATSNENLPLNIRLGGAYRFAALGRKNTVALDVTKERSQGAVVAAGFETHVIDALPMRVGFNTGNDAGPGVTAGFGYEYGRFSFDYAFAPYGDLGLTNRISVTWRFGAAEGPNLPPLPSSTQ